MARHPAVIGITPFERPDPGLAAALARAGCLGVLDLGSDRDAALGALERLLHAVPDGVGVRVPDGCPIDPDDLPNGVGTVVLSGGVAIERWCDYAALAQTNLLVQAVSVDQARDAVANGAAGVIAKGAESGGPVGEEGAFVLLQRIVAEQLDVPIWAQGGIGLETAAAARASGATGVVVDVQLALARECELPESVRAAVRASDGSDTVVIDGCRFHERPGSEQSRLPMGQDAALAARLAERYETAGRIARAIGESMNAGVRSARRVRPLAEGSGFAREHCVRYPIAQGPMTRVSDVAAFADAVSAGGALPFLALALMRGPQIRELLAETAELLGSRPWGVGILGFVPQELRDEQLAAVREIPPQVALVAGGRPSQARELEEAEIKTYLHVPSPILLEQFLKQGVRRFVFEGRECGGHVGPRTSFTLWQSQLDVLMRHGSPDELSILFAGGIHDGRSAAMVEAMTAGLAEQGASIGAIMGTAYLFTDEAIDSGAISPSFRQAALESNGTVLLETAPGHATRCADTPFAQAFQAEKARLEGEGRPPQEIWEALEQLNLGRLRLASKGLRRDGDDLVTVDDETQRRDGMVMIGQVAALRHVPSTIDELHRAVCEGAGEQLAHVEVPEPARAKAPQPADIAIVGMSAVLPGAPDLDTYWSNVLGGVDSISEVPPERWSADAFFDPESMSGEYTPSKWGGFIDGVVFDPTTYGIPPVSLAAIEPAQLLALEVSRRALADAGYLDSEFDRERASVIFGAEAGSELSAGYGFRSLWRQYAGELPAELDEVLPTLTEDSFPGILANVIAGRIANRLDLGGVNYTVDAACAASLAALDLAVKELTTGTSDLVLCGGVDLHNGLHDYLAFSAVHALSRAGQCRTFSADADGIVLGEGVVVVVLRRLADAERDGDRIYAVVKGVGGSSDGKSLGLTAPRRDGQIRALDRAYEAAGISPAEVGLVEAHGTGTVVGDRTELQTLEHVFGRAGAEPGSCALGSVKSQIGHTKCAAGLAGLAKTALALHHGILPPTSNISDPNPAWDGEQSPFVLNQEARPWRSAVRNAGVSAFGFGGTNFHVVLSEHASKSPRLDATPAPGLVNWPAELFLVRGTDRDEAVAQLNRVGELVETANEWTLRDLAYSLAAQPGPVQVAFLASDRDDLAQMLARARAFEGDDESVFVATRDLGQEPKIAFLFPGQGSQRVGMLADLYVAFPRLRDYLELGPEYADRMLPATAWTPEQRQAQRDALTDTRVAQPALGLAGLTVASLLASLGVRPDLAGGHSYGELVALAAAGAIDEGDLLKLSEQRAQSILEAIGQGEDPGAMAAATAARSAVEPHLEGLDRVVIANDNAPDQVVISGPTAAVELAVERLDAAGISSRNLPVACAFHSPLVAEAGKAFAEYLAETEIAQPAFPTFANTTAALHPDDPDSIRELLSRQIGAPIRFVEQIEAMYEAGARIFVEAGPGRVLSGLAQRILEGRPHATAACDVAGENGITQLLRAVATLAVNGVAVDVRPLFAQRADGPLRLDALAGESASPNAWLVNGHIARPLTGELPPHALKPISSPVFDGASRPTAPAESDEAVVLEYLRSTRDLVAAQHEVVLGFLGVEAGEGRRPPRREPKSVEPVADATGSNGEGPEPTNPAPAPEALTPRTVLLDLVSERTGYPVEMLDIDLDLEADLSIDSIKRIEILGALDERLGGSGAEEVPEELVAVKTLRGILQVIEQSGRTTDSAPAATAPTEAAETEREAYRAQTAAGEPDTHVVPKLGRYVLALDDLDLLGDDSTDFAGQRLMIVDDARGIAAALAKLLRERGATAWIVHADDELEAAECLVDLSLLQLDASPEAAKRLFERVREAIGAGTTRVIAATGLGGSFGRDGNGHEPTSAAGAAGLLRSIAKERVDVTVRTVDLVPDADPAELARHLLGEISTHDGPPEVGYENGYRRTLRPRAQPRNGEVQSGTLLDRDSVVLITGGARGITAHVARGLAERYGCKLELIGRTALSDVREENGLRDAVDAAAIRRALAEHGELSSPAEIESATGHILAQREIRATLAALEAAGSGVSYHAVDVRHATAFGRTIDEIYEREGRIDAVIHGAGVIEDKLLADKTMDSFARVFDTKVAAALTLARHLRDDVKLVCFFSSVASAFGSRGQSDYAAANDVLDKLAAQLNHRYDGRVFAINWGPWGDGGMVSPQLEREFERRGIGLIGSSEGVESFLEELEHGGPDDVQVVLVKADPAALA